MTGAPFAGLGFCATFQNADPSVIAPLGVARALAVQVAWGMQPSPDTDLLPAWIDRCRTFGLDVVPWAWCAATTVDGAAAEGRYHAERCAALGLTETFVANAEEAYDAHGDSSSPRYLMVTAYVRAFTQRAGDLRLPFAALGLTSTPRFGSDVTAAIQAGWTGMPQAFPLAVPGATIAACVDHWRAWGWPTEQLRPLVQTYRTDGAYPPARAFLDESAAAGVGVAPYTVEQALDAEGRALLAELAPAVNRGGNTVEKIGPQSGIVAFANWLRAQPDVAGRGPHYDPAKIATWPMVDKLERALTILAADHDANR